MATLVIAAAILVFTGIPALIFYSACVCASREDRIEEARDMGYEF